MNQSLAERNFNYLFETDKLIQKVSNDFLLIGQRLHKIYTENIWEVNYDTYKDYLDDKKISKATDSKLRNIYSTFILEYSFSRARLAKAGGWTVVAGLLPYSTTKAKAEVWLDKAETLMPSDLTKEKMEAKTGIRMDKCPHKNSHIIQIMVCDDCGDRIRIYDTEETK